jgi:hypothetical protein
LDDQALESCWRSAMRFARAIDSSRVWNVSGKAGMDADEEQWLRPAKKKAPPAQGAL